jgi:hypothetical protein
MATKNLGLQNFYIDSLKDILNSDDTVIFLNSVPTPIEGFLVISPDDPIKKEIIYYTSVNSGAGSVTVPSVALGRGLGGTTAQYHIAGEPVKMNITAEYWKALQDGTAVNHVDAINIETFRKEVVCDGVATGLTVTQTSGRVGSILGGVAYIQGVRVVTTTQSYTFTASKDTYIDLSKDGVFTYVEMANGSGYTNEAAITANSVRIAKVVTDASNIVIVYDRRPWQWIKIKPYRTGVECGTFHNSWTYYEASEVNWEHIYFMKDPMGYVHFRGLSVGGAYNGTALIVMPPGFRIKTVGSQGSIYTVSGNDAHARVDVRPNGFICPTSGAGWLSICAIHYKAEQ